MRNILNLTLSRERSLLDNLFMRRCFDLGRLGAGQTKTNPMVGALIVKDNKILSEGYHQSYGGPHAEVNAINPLRAINLSHTTLYSSLEPCSHYGKTPPCADLIIKHQIGHCHISNIDVNPNVRGKGLERLRNHGVEVVSDVCKKEGEALLKPFIIQQKLKRPYIILKWAQSRDGFMGKQGERVKISGPVADRLVHKWRKECDGIMVGSNTVIVDDPHLGNRLFHGLSPARIILDRQGRISPQAMLWKSPRTTYYFTSPANKDGPQGGVRSIKVPDSEEPLTWMLTKLYQLNIGSILVEGGPELLSRFLQLELWDEIRVITNPMLLYNGLSAPYINLPIASKYRIAVDEISIYHRLGAPS